MVFMMGRAGHRVLLHLRDHSHFLHCFTLSKLSYKPKNISIQCTLCHIEKSTDTSRAFFFIRRAAAVKKNAESQALKLRKG